MAVAFASLVGTGCARAREAQAQGERDDAGKPPPPPAGPITVDVPGDKPVLAVLGKPSIRRPIIHLHGMCEHPRRNLEAWGGVASDHGTIIALIGDLPCPDRPGTTKWSDDAAKLDARIAMAMTAVNASAASRGTSLDGGEVLVVGESMGAARAESLAKANPERYGRLVLVGSPQVVSPANVRGARAVANLAGERESQQMARNATLSLSRAGLPSQFWELAGASHGEYGPDGERIMSEAIGFVATR